MTFRPGQRIEVVESKCMPESAKGLVGKVGTVVGMDHSIIGMLARELTTHDCYVVDLDGLPEQFVFCGHMLKPIDERGDWNEIERTTGYKPPALVPA